MRFAAHRIPSWTVALVGGVVTTGAVAIGPLYTSGLDAALREQKAKFESLRWSQEEHWRTISLAENLWASADVMMALAARPRAEPNSFRLRQAGWHIVNAIAAMGSGAVMEPQQTGRTDREMMGFVDQLSNGDLPTYFGLVEIIEDLRNNSGRRFQRKWDEMEEVSTCIATIEAKRDSARRLQENMNVTGLAVLLTAGLPIWRRPYSRKSKRRRGHDRQGKRSKQRQ